MRGSCGRRRLRILGQNRCAHYIPFKIECTDLPVVPGRSPPPLRARSLHGRQPSPSCFNSTFHTPCTRCRSISAGAVGRARERAGSTQNHPPCAHARFMAANPLPAVSTSRSTPPAPTAGRFPQVRSVVHENGPGRPRITPPARMLASWPPTLSQLFQLHVPHPLHPLQVYFRRYSQSCTRTGRVAPESPPLRTRSLHGRQPSPSGFNSTFTVPHPLHPLQVDFRRYGRLCTRTGRVAPDSPTLRARSLHPLHRVRDCWKQADELAG